MQLDFTDHFGMTLDYTILQFDSKIEGDGDDDLDISTDLGTLALGLKFTF